MALVPRSQFLARLVRLAGRMGQIESEDEGERGR